MPSLNKISYLILPVASSYLFSEHQDRAAAKVYTTKRGSRKFCQRGSNFGKKIFFAFFVLVVERRDGPNTT